MKTLVVYDSVFGNTEKVAQAIAAGLGPDAALKRVSEVKPEDLDGLALLVAGSPTRAFRPTPAMSAFLRGLRPGSLAGKKVAAFDTRFPYATITDKFLKTMVRMFGYAAEKMAKGLEKKGGTLAAQPEGFAVKDSEGPLAEGELRRAEEWGRRLKGGG